LMGCDVLPAGDAFPPGVDPAALAAFADRCAAALERADPSWCVVLGNDAFIADLNATYRSIPRPTDVLSFPQVAFSDGPNEGPADELGDVIVSVETAARQAEEHGHPLAVEIEILVVHGLCHLLGWDHEDPADALEMRTVEAQVLAAAGSRGVGLVRRAEV